ncbi:hypothetical protein HWB60_gp029 [Mycobacterium phage TChen]|uniref:Uncharacterized protein n=1 Tax=Mycobacterium phage TChen TaxID=2163598 RepID=A0A2S1PCY2_9CAUD|nr:hypothetical protein HWB60_gp029 [Mycobacterium phage TChen]AWH14430.1 hypothetical protein SEA_TCHEN_29 [Mycobacterium phage TChen]
MGILNRIIDFDPIIDRAVDKAMGQVPVIIDALEKKLLAMLPLLAAAAAKAIVDEIAEHIPAVPMVGDVMDIADKVRKDLNDIPDIDIPILSDIFDLTEFLKGRR